MCVLLSSYNGEKYIREQIESILAQSVGCSIVVRDDGSTDNTKEILQQYAEEGRLFWYEGENIGPSQSFLNLLKNSPEAEYYAFCDQDDVWLSDKMSNAIEKLEANDAHPLKCYFSAYTPVNQRLELVDIPLIPVVPFALEAEMVTNSAVGCTMVISKGLRDKVNEYFPKSIFMHDWWVYLVCLAHEGITVYDDRSGILYRQHGNNICGANETLISKIKRRTNASRRKFKRSNFAKELLEGYQDSLNPDICMLLKELAEYDMSFINRIKFVLTCKYKTGFVLKDILFRIDAITGSL